MNNKTKMKKKKKDFIKVQSMRGLKQTTEIKWAIRQTWSLFSQSLVMN
jgi:hypothetical protein